MSKDARSDSHAVIDRVLADVSGERSAPESDSNEIRDSPDAGSPQWAHHRNMTNAFFLMSPRHRASRAARAVAGVAAAVVFAVALVCVVTLFGGPSAPGSARTTTPQWRPVPTSQDIAVHQS